MKKILILGILLISCQLFYGQITTFNWPSTAPMSEFYSVKASYGDQEYELHTHVSKPNLDIDPTHPDEGHGVTGYLQDRTSSFVQFDFEGEIVVEVNKLYGSAAWRVEIQPKMLGIEPFFFDGRTVKFKLKHTHDIPPYLSVKFFANDNQDSDANGGFDVKNSMLIFANKPETYKPSLTTSGVVKYSNTANLANANIIYFEAGDYDLTERFKDTGKVGQLSFLKAGQKVYLEGGAFVRGAFDGHGLSDLALYGRGTVTGQDLYWHSIRDENDKKDAFCNFTACDDLHIEGIVIENPTHHTIPSDKRTYIKNLKIIGWASNQDGIRPGDDSEIDGIFIKTSDDYDYARSPHIVKNSVFWSAHNGAVGMLGWNNLGTGYAEYTNCAFINNETKVLDKRNTGIIGSVAKDGMKLQNNKLSNLYIEDKHAFLVNATIENHYGYNTGYLRNFEFKNITTEYPFQLKNGEIALQKMKGIQNNWIEGWKFINLIVGGVLVTWDNYQDYFDLDLIGSNGLNTDQSKFVRNIAFSKTGDLYKVSYQKSGEGKILPEGNGHEVDCIGGMSQTITILPDQGNKVKDVLVNGVSIGPRRVLILDDISDNHSIEVEFESGDDYYALKTSSETFKLNDGADLRVYPIPANQTLTIESIINKNLGIVSVYNVDGCKVFTSDHSSSQQARLDIHTLHTGWYILKCESEGNCSIKKFYKK